MTRFPGFRDMTNAEFNALVKRAEKSEQPAKPHKYHAQKTYVDGIPFDSKREATRYGELKLLEKAGKINALIIHPAFPIVYRDTLICIVFLDFKYHDEARGEAVYEDTKGYDNDLSRLKRKLVCAFYGITVEVVK